MKKKEYKVGDVVSLYFKTPSAIGYNGILCRITMVNGDRYFCESIYGSAGVWAREGELIKQN